MAAASAVKGVFNWYFKTNLLLRILAGLALGVVAGLVFGDAMLWVAPFGDLFIRLLKMIVMPIIVSTLIVGAASVSPAHLGKTGIKVVAFYLLTSAFAVAVGLLFGNIFHPGAGLDLASATQAAGQAVEQPSLAQTLLNIVPTNVFAAVSSGAVLPTIFFSILFGIGLSYLRVSEDERIKRAGESLFTLFDGIAEIMFIIVKWVLEYAPIGVFALIAVVFAEQNAAVLGSLAMVVVAVYVALAVHLFLVYGGLLSLNKISLPRFLRRGRPAMLTAFVTRSSGGTLPVTMDCTDNMGVKRKVSSFSLPLGATINMDGTAIYQGICVLFIAFAVGLPLSLMEQLTVILTAVLASIGTAGVPGAGAIMLLIVLKSVGLDLDEGSAVAAAYAMILGVDALLDMGRTSINVTGDMAATMIVAKSQDDLDTQRWSERDDARADGAAVGE